MSSDLDKFVDGILKHFKEVCRDNENKTIEIYKQKINDLEILYESKYKLLEEIKNVELKAIKEYYEAEILRINKHNNEIIQKYDELIVVLEKLNK